MEVRRLAGLAGFEGAGLDRIVRLTVVNGFPDTISCELQQLSGVIKVEMSEIISRARILVANKSVNSSTIVAAAVGDANEDVPETRKFSGACYRCGGPHMAKFCRMKGRGLIVCYRCNQTGHIASQCGSVQTQGNSKWVAGAPVATHQE